MYQNILIPINEGKKTNSRCIQEATKVLSKDSVIHILYADDNSDVSKAESGALTHAEEMLEKKDSDYTLTRIEEGEPTEEILRYDEKMPIDLIVMYTYSRSGIQRLLENSYTEEVINSTETPVLVISEPGKD